MQTYLFDFSKVLLFSNDLDYSGDLNPRYKQLKDAPNFLFFDHFRLNQEIIEYLTSKATDSKFYIFTSGSIQNAPELEGKLSVFREIFSAEELGLHKKESSSYTEIVRLLRKPAQEVTFIDDSPENISAAAVAGLKVVHYLNNHQLMEYLK